MKHEFPAHIVAIAKKHNVTMKELDDIYGWLKDFTDPSEIDLIIDHNNPSPRIDTS